MNPIIRLNDLSVHHGTARGPLKAVQDVSLDLMTGETLGLVGESGCGKSTLARCIVGLTQPTAGAILVEGAVIGKGLTARRAMAAQVQMVFQDPMSSLNPRLSISRSIELPLVVHGIGTRVERQERVRHLMEQVGLGPHLCDRLPHELSGGQRQRVSIARALALEPRVLVCDEAVSALDVSVQAQILNLLARLQQETGITVLFISHDLSVVRFVSDRIAVMYLGRVVEIGPAESVWNDPRHPYTRALLASNPDGEHRDAPDLQGDPPSPISPPSGCTFRTRCPRAQEICAAALPSLSTAGLPHAVACHLANAPDTAPPPTIKGEE